jgi:alginate export protein
VFPVLNDMVQTDQLLPENGRRTVRTLYDAARVLAWLAGSILSAQISDPGQELNKLLLENTGDRFKLTFEFRVRPEARTGNNFGRSPDLENPLFRTRIGAQLDATDWLRISAMGQDSRAPEYGRTPPSSARDTMDLHQAFLEFFAKRKTGFGAVFGRQMVSLGEGRLIGVPDWLNTARTYDTARLYYRLPGARIEVLLLSAVRVRPDAFNRPDFGDRLWGTYDSFSKLIPHGTVEVYLLRHDRNPLGGFTGQGPLGINTVGGRAAGPLPWSLKYSMEAAAQNGKTRSLAHRGYAWFSGLSRRVPLRLPLDLEVEYKYASGSKNPGMRDGTFDQLYAANHDKFGHADLFGWRNLHDLRSLDTVHITKPIALNFMYNNWWLASPRDTIYNGSGAPIVPAKTTAGRHVGQEADSFATYQVSGWTFGAGFAHIFAGEFLRNTTPGVNTRYLYVFQSYSF